MSCPDHQTIVAFVDGELETVQAAEMEQHLTACSNCRHFAEEVDWVENCGRAALRAIPVGEAVEAKIDWGAAPRPKRVQTILLALAAMVAIALFLWTWLGAKSLGPHEAQHQFAIGGAAMGGAGRRSQESEDAAFERWAAPYRRLQIPLVPVEEAASYDPAPISPIQPNEIERNR